MKLSYDKRNNAGPLFPGAEISSCNERWSAGRTGSDGYIKSAQGRLLVPDRRAKGHQISRYRSGILWFCMEEAETETLRLDNPNRPAWNRLLQRYCHMMEFFNSFNKKKGFLVHDAGKCHYCGLCQKRCPHKAIKVEAALNSWKLRMICMKCGRCVRECPQKALTIRFWILPEVRK